MFTRTKRSISVIAGAAMIVATAGGCASMNNKEKGAAIGAGVGAAAGAAIGRNNGGTAKGAIIGAVVGGAAGAVIGHQMDQQADELGKDLPGADVSRVGEGILVNFPSGILFPFDSENLQPNGRQNLADLAQSLQKYPKTTVLVVGHTDAKGSDEYNMALSQRRAQSAKNYLVSQGIDGSRIQTEGRGETEPVASNDTEVGRQQNRRVEVAIYASDEYRQQVLDDVGH